MGKCTLFEAFARQELGALVLKDGSQKSVSQEGLLHIAVQSTRVSDSALQKKLGFSIKARSTVTSARIRVATCLLATNRRKVSKEIIDSFPPCLYPLKIAQPKWFCQPATAALFEKGFGVGPGYITGHKNDAVFKRGHGFYQSAVERGAVDARHFEVADNEVVGLLLDALERVLSIRGSVNTEAGIRQGVGDRFREGRFIIHDEYGRAGSDGGRD